jgi:phasin family protein
MLNPGGEAMLKLIMPEQNAERATQVANYGMDWMRQFMEESLNQTRAIFDGFLTTARKTADSFDQQAAEVRERSMSMAADTLSNSMDFVHRALKVRQPQDLLPLQTKFVSRQAQVVAENSKMLGETIARGASEMGQFASHGLEEASRRSEAA